MAGKEVAPIDFSEVIDANRELNILRSLKRYRPPFQILRNYHLVDNGVEPEATVVLRAGGREIHEADTGVGPVDALANTLKKALKPAFPFIEGVHLIDYSAGIHESRSGTKATVAVTVLLSDGDQVWKVSEMSKNINQASFHALLGGYEFAIANRKRKKKKPKG
jgi:2-isopropylmalate synthase